MIQAHFKSDLQALKMRSDKPRPDSPHAFDTPRLLTSPTSTPMAGTVSVAQASLEQLLAEIKHDFERQTDLNALLRMSKKLQVEMREHLVIREQRMLPSFNYNLPNGHEQGTYLALEVGGSNLRMAMVELAGRHMARSSMRILRIDTSPINLEVKQLGGHGFFDWMAGKILKMLLEETKTSVGAVDTKPLRMGVAWSFPIESVPMVVSAAKT